MRRSHAPAYTRHHAHTIPDLRQTRINDAGREGRALAALGTSPTKIPMRFAAALRFVDFLIKKGLPTREVSMKDSLRAFCRGLPFGIRRLKPILPFLGGRSDAACRVVIPLYAFPVDNHTLPATAEWRVSDTRTLHPPPHTIQDFRQARINAAAREGRALAALDTSPTEIPMRFAVARRSLNLISSSRGLLAGA